MTATSAAEHALDRLERYERGRERRRIRVSDHARPGDLDVLAASYQRQGLRPIIDPLLEVIRVDCVVCRAGDALYRPARVMPRARYRADGKPVDALLTIICDACGFHDERPL